MSATPTLAIIGAGQIGCRHMQSIVSAGLAPKLWMVDPSPGAESLVGTRLREMRTHDACAVPLGKGIEDLPDPLDVAVIATSSLVRMEVLDELLASRTVRHVVLEKFLFPRFSDYARAQTLISEAGTGAFVNCPRRLFAGYRALKDELEAPLRLSVRGTGWGLACNSVHWLDLLSFLEPCTRYQIRSDLTGPFSAKRQGYVDFFGTIEVADGLGNSLDMRCLDGESVSVDCIIEDSAGRVCEVSEQRREMKEGGVARKFPVPFQSELTAQVVRDLLERGTCGLTRYESSARLHQLLLGEFLRVYNQRGALPDNELCPVT
jgi:hypothetical protein